MRAPNMEFVVYIVALVVAASDALTIASWLQFYLITTSIYTAAISPRRTTSRSNAVRALA
jgi:hypothetical protein